jgi:hypothetical protein
MAAAAESCGSNVTYIRAAIALLQSENAVLLNCVLTGKCGLLDAATVVERRAKLIAAYRKADAGDLVALGEAVGPDDIWDRVVVPSM